MNAARSEPDGGTPVTVPGAWSRDVRSRDGSEYRLLFWRPPGPAPEGDHRTAFLLDGNAVFATAVEAMRLRLRKSQDVAAIVAIGHPGPEPFDTARRVFDFTPPGDGPPPPRRDGTPWPASGGAERFLDMLNETVKPLARADLAAGSGSEALIGHSLGGLLALHCLFTRSDMFATFIAASPSLWWNGGAILTAERAFLAAGGPRRPTRLLVTRGGAEGPPPSVPPAGATADALAARLGRIHHLSSVFHVFPGETHGSVLQPSIARGLRFVAEDDR